MEKFDNSGVRSIYGMVIVFLFMLVSVWIQVVYPSDRDAVALKLKSIFLSIFGERFLILMLL